LFFVLTKKVEAQTEFSKYYKTVQVFENNKKTEIKKECKVVYNYYDKRIVKVSYGKRVYIYLLEGSSKKQITKKGNVYFEIDAIEISSDKKLKLSYDLSFSFLGVYYIDDDYLIIWES
jgi:hypothetical protein